MPELTLLQRETAVIDGEGLSPGAIRRLLRGSTGYETGFTLPIAPVEAKNQTRFIVVRRGKRVEIHALLLIFNKNPAKGDDPNAGSEYAGNITVTLSPWDDGEESIRVTFTEGMQPGYGAALIRDVAKTAAWPVPRPVRWKFEHAFNNKGSIFESEEVLFSVAFREADIFFQSSVVGFNLSRIDSDSAEVSSWNFGSWCGRLLQSLDVDSRRPRLRRIPPAKSRLVSVTNDILMMMRNRAYSPANLNAEMAALRVWGVGRIHWIDNTGYPGPRGSNIQRSIAACGDLPKVACKAAQAHSLEFIADTKLFDISFLSERAVAAGQPSLPMFDGSVCRSFSPLMNQREDIFAESNPAWRRSAEFPITTLRLYSLEPLPSVGAKDVALLQSADNLDYQRVASKTLKVSSRKIKRANLRWAVDGIHPEPGSVACWMIEIRGIRIEQPFLSIRICSEVGLLNRHFAALEAESGQGVLAPFIIGTPVGGLMPFERAASGAPRRHYSFTAAGMLSGGDEPVVALKRWPLANIGVSFQEPDFVPGMLEPTHPAARDVWMQRIATLLDAGVDGIGIRTLRHHRGCHSWTRYSYAPTAVAAFRGKYGRDPSASAEDVLRMRAVRGEGFSRFIGDVSDAVRQRGKKLIFQLELVGGPLDAINSRMGFDFNLRKWIQRRWVDEIHIRPISGHHPWLRSVLLPFAHRHGVGVHLVTPNAASGYTHAELMQMHRLADDAAANGYSGINIYETTNLYDLSEADAVQPRALGKAVVESVVERFLRRPQ